MKKSKTKKATIPKFDPVLAQPQRKSKRRNSRIPFSNSRTLTTSHSNNDMSLLDKSQWENMSNVINPKDDFLCLPNNDSYNDLPLTKKAITRRKSSNPIVPKERNQSQAEESPEQQKIGDSFKSICDYNKETNIDNILSLTKEITSKKREELGYFLQFIMEKMEKYNNLIYDPITCSREYYVAQKLCINLSVESDRQHVHLLQNDIRTIAELEDFLKSSEKKPHVNFQLFRDIFLSDTNEVDKASDNSRIFKEYAEIIPKPPKTVHWEDVFMHPSQKTGRIIHRLIANISDMTYYDIEVIIKALCPDESLIEQVRQLIFDISWEYYLFPYADVNIIKLPDIFDLSPRIFSPSFLSDEFLDTPFNIINNTNWPLKDASNDLFNLLIETDPFVIADRMWDIISKITKIANALFVEEGGNPDDADIGFEDLFKYLLVCVFAFGVSEVLEAMSFCGQFYEFNDPENSQRHFAMAHCNGLVKYITSLNSVDLHNKFGQK